MRAVLFGLLAAFVIVLLWVALANAAAEVELSLGFGDPRELPLAAVIVGAVIAGTIFTGVLAVIECLALRLENRRLRKQIKRLEDEVHDLRNLALTDDGGQNPSSAVELTEPAAPQSTDET